MATPQSDLQGFIQSVAGTQTTAQSAVPGAANNGNPNTAYNWSTYLPQFSVGQQPTASFDLLTAQAPASSPGYTPPFAADPYAAAVLAGIPRAQPNDNVNRILSNLFGNNPWGSAPPASGTPAPGTPGAPAPAPGTPGPTGPRTPANPPMSGPVPGRVPQPVGPISGPIARDPHDWYNNYQNAMPNTSLREAGLGREGVLVWLNQQTSQHINPADRFNVAEGPMAPGSEEGSNWATNLWDSITEGVSGVGRQIMNSARDFVQDVTFQNGAAEGIVTLLTLFNPLLGRGARAVMNQLGDLETLTPEQLETLTTEITRMSNEAISELGDRGMEQAFASIDEAVNRYEVPLDDPGFDAEAYFNAQGEWGAREWDNLQSRVGLINFMNSFGQGVGTNPITGVHNQDLIDNQQSARAEAAMEILRNLERTRRRMK